MDQYDLAVIGAGPAGHFGAIQAAKSGRRVVVIEMRDRLGGNSTNYGTIPSKALREAAIHLAGIRQRAFYGRNYRVKNVDSLLDLTLSTRQIVDANTAVSEHQLQRNGVDILHGKASFVGPNRLVVESGSGMHVLEASKTLVACGSRPAHPPSIDFDGEFICDSNEVLKLDRMPDRLIVIGGGVIGIEYASIFSAIGVSVTLIHDRATFLDFCDTELVELLKYQLASRGVRFRTSEKVSSLEKHDGVVVARTESNKTIVGDCVLFCGGRQGNTDSLNLEAAGLEADKRGRLTVDDQFRTNVPDILAAGDVIGFPALAATSREQGRRAVCGAFGLECEKSSSEMPYGIYAIPEISMFGPTEAQLTESKTRYEVGLARYREIARGQILGDFDGLLKMLFCPDTLKIHAVHIVGEQASELVHIGQAVQALGGTIEYFSNTVFNYPTLAECYKVAALDGLNRVRVAKSVSQSDLDAVSAG